MNNPISNTSLSIRYHDHQVISTDRLIPHSIQHDNQQRVNTTRSVIPPSIQHSHQQVNKTSVIPPIQHMIIKESNPVSFLFQLNNLINNKE